MSNRRSRTQRWWPRLLAAGLLPASLGAGVGHAQTASASALKAAFVFNFVRFTDWPAETTGPVSSPLVVCMLEAGNVAEEFRQISRGRTPSGRPIEIRVTRKDDQLRSCHALYVSGLDQKQSDQLIASLNDTSVLTISDDERFAERGGLVNFVLQNNTMGFAVNVAAVQRSRLQLSAKVLALARIVRR
jgi:hypothetical protein